LANHQKHSCNPNRQTEYLIFVLSDCRFLPACIAVWIPHFDPGATLDFSYGATPDLETKRLSLEKAPGHLRRAYRVSFRSASALLRREQGFGRGRIKRLFNRFCSSVRIQISPEWTHE